MQRLKAGRVAVLFAKIRRKEHLESAELEELESHYEALNAEDAFTRLVREVGETIGEQRGLISAQQQFMQQQSATLEASTGAITRLAEAQAAANEIERQKLEDAKEAKVHRHDMERLTAGHTQEMEKQRLAQIWKPIVGALLGLLTGAFGKTLVSLVP